MTVGTSAGYSRVGRMRDERVAYLDRALEIMRRHSINRGKVDWNLIRRECLELAGRADDQASLYEACDLMVDEVVSAAYKWLLEVAR